MSKRIFSKEEIELLQANNNIATCTEKSITYRKEFKIWAVKKYHEGYGAIQIFKEAGINIALVGQDAPSDCLKRWRKIFEKKGESGLAKEARGGPRGKRGTKHLSDREKLKYLEAEVAYLKAENAFLAKLRKQRLN